MPARLAPGGFGIDAGMGHDPLVPMYLLVDYPPKCHAFTGYISSPTHLKHFRCNVAHLQYTTGMNAKYGDSPMATANSLYGRDFYTWAMETARAIRERRFEGIEWDAVAEELEDMGKSEKRALESQLERLHAHLLKWRLQSEKRHQDVACERSWRATISGTPG